MRKHLLPILLLSMLIYALCAEQALAVPPIPFSPYGTAKVNGANVADGTVIGAWCSGVPYDTTTTQSYGGESWYGLSIRGDDPDTAGVKEGCAAGETISFKIGAQWANQTAIWTSGAGPRLDLTANTATATPSRTATATRTRTPTPSTTPTPSQTPTPSRTASATPTPSRTPTPTATATFTPTATPSRTATATMTPPSTPTPSATRSVTPSATPTWTLTPSVTPTPTRPPSPTASPTATLPPTPTRRPTPTSPPPTPTPGPDDIVLNGLVYDQTVGLSAGLPGARVVMLLCVPITSETQTDAAGFYRLILWLEQAQFCADVSIAVMVKGYQPAIGVYTVASLRNQPQRNFGLAPIATVTPAARRLYVPLLLKD